MPLGNEDLGPPGCNLGWGALRTKLGDQHEQRSRQFVRAKTEKKIRASERAINRFARELDCSKRFLCLSEGFLEMCQHQHWVFWAGRLRNEAGELCSFGKPNAVGFI